MNDIKKVFVKGKVDEQKVSQEVLDMFSPIEGFNNLYYGNVRQGKSYAATADILDLLEQGEIVYCNWEVNFKGFDERKIRSRIFLKFLFGKKFLFNYKKENFHYFHPDEVDVAFLGRLVGVHIFIDEGQWIFNSHIRNPDPEARKLILHGGHYCRSLNIITQRPVNVFKDIRSQINIWYKCEKLFSWPFILFRRQAYENMKEDIPDEDIPSGRPKLYIGRRRIFDAYNTHAMRGDHAIAPNHHFDVMEVTRWQLLKLYFRSFATKRNAERSEVAKES